MFQLVIPMFQAVGIDAQMRTMDRSLWETRVRQGRDFDATAHKFGANGGIAAMLDARYYVPNSANAIYAPGWQLWYRDRANPRAVEPRRATKKQLALYDKLSATASSEGRAAIMKEILQGAAEAFYVFGVSAPPDSYGIVKKNMRNITQDHAELLRLANARTDNARAVLQGLTSCLRSMSGCQWPAGHSPLAPHVSRLDAMRLRRVSPRARTIPANGIPPMTMQSRFPPTSCALPSGTRPRRAGPS